MNITYVSPSIEKVLGFTVEERLKQSLQEQMPPETLQMAAERLTEELEFDEEKDPERFASLELDYYHKDGALRCLETTLSFIRDEHGKPVGIHGISRDITERKPAEELIRKSEQEKSLILDNAFEIIAFHNKDRRFIWANRAYLEGVTSITGLPATIDALKGKKCYEAWGLTSDCTNCPVSLALETGKPQEGELTPENQEHWPATQGSWLVRAAPVRDSIGKIVGAIEISNENTVRKRAEQALRDSEKNYRDIFENSNDAIFVHDTENGQIIDVNRTACEMFGYSLEEMRRMNVGDFSLAEPPHTQKEALEWIQKAYQYGPQRFD